MEEKSNQEQKHKDQHKPSCKYKYNGKHRHITLVPVTRNVIDDPNSRYAKTSRYERLSSAIPAEQICLFCGHTYFNHDVIYGCMVVAQAHLGHNFITLCKCTTFQHTRSVFDLNPNLNPNLNTNTEPLNSNVNHRKFL